MSRSLCDLLLSIAPVDRLRGVSDTAVTAITADSRAVRSGSIFVAVRGGAADGHRFIPQAVAAGAAAIIAESPGETDAVPVVVVENTRLAIAQLAAAFYDHPARQLALVGVTGTNGKTTTTHLVRAVLGGAGAPAGIIGTVHLAYGAVERTADATTPDPVALQSVLREMADGGMVAVVMEVSSHGLDQGRTAGLGFAAAGFTNLTLDHLDYHGTFEAYRLAKKRLFDGLNSDAVAVVNVDDPAGAGMLSDSAARPLTVSLTNRTADVCGEIIDNTLAGLRLRISYEGATYEGRFQLVGRFNGENLLVAFGLGVALGIAPRTVFDTLTTAPSVPGRMERIAVGERSGIVDYAHTPDALEKLLTTVNELKPDGARTVVVFGCGGDRLKRPIMGGLAASLADIAIITNDNPRTEDPARIADDVLAGVTGERSVEVVLDRRAAIRRAVALAAPGDVVVVAGKGHETYQIIGAERGAFDDRAELRAAFAVPVEA